MYNAKYFVEKEYTCKCGCGYAQINDVLLRIIDRTRDRVGRPLVITSGCRCEAHNKAVGGVPTSLHIKGCAVDIRAKTAKERLEIIKHALNEGATGIGVGKDFVHISCSDTTHEGVFIY